VAAELAGHVGAVASVLGATSIAALQEAYPGVPVFRLMPNTAVAVRRGIVCYAPAPGTDATLEAQVVALFGRLGLVVEIEERLIDAATAVMGVGPAYQALLAEAQIDAAARHGLSPVLAARLVVETMAGSAALLSDRDYDTLAVRREVTSPGGSTARGLRSGALMLLTAITQVDIANYVNALFEVYIVLIFVYILLNLLFSFGVKT